MHKNRTAAKVDSNQSVIVETLRSIPGITVELQHDDILVGYKGKTYWYEIKNPDCLNKNGEFKKGTIKNDQVRLLTQFTGHYKIVTSFNQILKDIGI